MILLQKYCAEIIINELKMVRNQVYLLKENVCIFNYNNNYTKKNEKEQKNENEKN